MTTQMPKGLTLLEQKAWYEQQAAAIENEMASVDARVDLAKHVYAVLGIEGTPNDVGEKARVGLAKSTLDELARDSEGARKAVENRQRQLTEARSRAAKQGALVRRLALKVADDKGVTGDDKDRVTIVLQGYGLGVDTPDADEPTPPAPANRPPSPEGGHTPGGQ